MALALIDPTAAAERLRQCLGVDPTSDEGLADMLRAEVHGRGWTQRASALDRIRRLLQPVFEVDEARLVDLCDTLAREGDLTRAPGGVLTATPLRAVPLASGAARLFSSLPTTPLASVLGAPVQRRGAARAVVWQASLASYVESVGGRVITPEAWAGLDRAPVADGAFVDRLDERLAWEAEPAGSLERDEPLEWRGWVPDGDRPGWRRDAAGGRLWIARTAFRGDRRAWTQGDGSPAISSFVSVTIDEADRARFALSRLAGSSPILRVEHGDGHVILDVPGWLPRPEYRWLSLQAESMGASSTGTRWHLASGAEAGITRLLADRLGLVVEAT